MAMCASAVAVVIGISIATINCTPSESRLAHSVLDILDEVRAMEDTQDADGPTECPVVVVNVHEVDASVPAPDAE